MLSNKFYNEKNVALLDLEYNHSHLHINMLLMNKLILHK